MFQYKDRISAAQFRRLIYLVMLPVTLRTMQGRLAETAGSAGWLVPLAVILPTLAAAWITVRLVAPRSGDRRGMGQAFCDILGPVAGHILNIAYLIWLMLLGCDVLRLYGERFFSSIYEHMTLISHFAGPDGLNAAGKFCGAGPRQSDSF